jgi:S-adenosylmethionine synthetase
LASAFPNYDHVTPCNTPQSAADKSWSDAPAGILSIIHVPVIDRLYLRNLIYTKAATYGHFGRDDIEFPWEKTDKAAALKKAAGL